MKTLYLILVIFFSCTTTKEVSQSPISNETKKNFGNFPIWIEYSKPIPDSIRDFVKIYMQTQGKRVLTMKEALELIFEQEKISFMNNLPTGNVSESDFIEKLDKLRKPVCNFLVAEIFYKDVKNEMYSDSIKWFVLQKPSVDTSKVYHTFSPLNSQRNTPYLVWKDFADTLLASGLLK